MLSSEASSEPGRWQTDRAAYQREILDAINDASVEQVVMMSSAQVGKTEILLNIIGYFVDYDPSPMLMLQPTLEMAQTFSKDRIAPMFRDTDRLKGKLQGPKSRSSGNTMLHKSFTGGHITMAGANSPASLASRPIRILLCDEVDRYPVSAGAEGDPVNLARKRTNNFWNRKIVLVSTPTIKGVSRIESAYESSTKEIYQLCCPGCGNYQQILRQHLVHFYIDDNKNELERVDAACESCGCLHTDVEWKSNPGRWLKLNPGHRHRGFHLNEYVSPWRRWVEIEHDFLDAKKSKEALKTFVNTSLGETWEEEGKTVNHSNLYLRREPYEKIPEKALLLVAGVDVQDDRIEGEVIAYGAEHESWGIESFVLHGDPGRPVLWQQLQQRIAKQYEHESGQYLSITATCVDSGGHYTQQVYEFCKKNQYRRVWAVKGASTAGKPIASRPSTNNKGGVKLFTVGTDAAKELIYSRLEIAEPGAGFCHFPQRYDEEYFQQLTAEKRVTRYVKGFPRLEWVKTRPRNEALDCRVYALAALVILNPVFEKLSKNLEPKSEAVEQQKQAQPTEQIVKQHQKKIIRKQRNKGFVNTWR